MAKKKKEALLELPVKWGNVSIGKKTIRLSAKTERKNLPLSKADSNLCDCRLTGLIISRSGDAQPGQKSLPGAEGNDIEIDSVYDVKKIHFDKDEVSFGLTFLKRGVDKNDVSQISGTNGVLIIHTSEEIPEEEPEDEVDEVDEEGDEEEGEE